MSGRAGSDYTAPLAAGLILFVALLGVSAVLDDGDTFWQIRAGEWILSHWAFPHTDPFSYTYAGQRWFTHEWGAQTLMALAHQAGGMRGIMVLTAVASGVTAGLLLYPLRLFMAAVPAVVVLIMGIANTTGSLLARPHVIAWPCLELWCAGLVLARARGLTPSWWLLPLMVLWVNLHGSFMLGLLLPFAFMAEAMLEAGAAWRDPAIKWARFILAAWACALLNPETIHGLIFPFQLLGMTNLTWIGEWHPTSFGSPHPLELLMMVLLGAGLLGRLTISPFRLLMVLGLIHMALKHWRHDQLVGIIGPLLLAEAIGRLAPPEWAPAAIRRDWVRPAMAAIAVVAVAARFTVPLDREQPGAGMFAALEEVPADLRAKPVLNDYSFGGQLIFSGVRPFIDSRADMYGDSFLGRFREIVSLNPDALNAALEEFHVSWTIFPPKSTTVFLLDRQPGWHRLVTHNKAVVHVRDTIAAR